MNSFKSQSTREAITTKYFACKFEDQQKQILQKLIIIFLIQPWTTETYYKEVFMWNQTQNPNL